MLGDPMEPDLGGDPPPCPAKSTFDPPPGPAKPTFDPPVAPGITNGYGEDAGFADFTVFAAHPWCCGLSPMSTWGGTANQRREPKKGVSGRPPPADPEEDEDEEDEGSQDQTVTQGNAVTSDQSHHGLEDGGDGYHGDRGRPHQEASSERSLLPPSDSFADFCSATPPLLQDDQETVWAELEEDEEKRWTRFTVREEDCQTSPSHRVQQLLVSSFPKPEDEEQEEVQEQEVLTLGVLLHLPDPQEDAPTTSDPRPQRMWRPHPDLHEALGLRFQWGGSHAHRTLLSCLRVDSDRTGTACPSKDCVPARGRPEDEPPVHPHSQQDPPSSRNSRGLRRSQDATPSLRDPHCWK